LAREATWNEAKKGRLIFHAQKLLQESALDGNFLKGRDAHYHGEP